MQANIVYKVKKRNIDVKNTLMHNETGDLINTTIRNETWDIIKTLVVNETK